MRRSSEPCIRPKAGHGNMAGPVWGCRNVSTSHHQRLLTSRGPSAQAILLYSLSCGVKVHTGRSSEPCIRPKAGHGSMAGPVWGCRNGSTSHQRLLTSRGLSAQAILLLNGLQRPQASLFAFEKPVPKESACFWG